MNEFQRIICVYKSFILSNSNCIKHTSKYIAKTLQIYTIITKNKYC